jgi:hypothetical protein
MITSQLGTYSSYDGTKDSRYNIINAALGDTGSVRKWCKKKVPEVGLQDAKRASMGQPVNGNSYVVC